jgi:hypothetical protein
MWSSNVLISFRRFLIVKKELLESFFKYADSKTRGVKDTTVPERIHQRRRLEQIFPRIVMTVTKQFSRWSSPITTYALGCTIYKPITASTLFSVCTTKRNRYKTTFCGASVYGKPLPHVRSGRDDDHLTEDSITYITLEDGGAITGTAVRQDWYGVHDGGKDLIVWLNGDHNDVSDHDSLETLIRLIPPSRNDERGRLPRPYHIDIRGLSVDALRWVPEFVSIPSTRRFLNLITTLDSWISPPDVFISRSSSFRLQGQTRKTDSRR